MDAYVASIRSQFGILYLVTVYIASFKLPFLQAQQQQQQQGPEASSSSAHQVKVKGENTSVAGATEPAEPSIAVR